MDAEDFSGRGQSCTSLYGVTSQNTAIFIYTWEPKI